ncbi:hypothetical protein ACFYYM_40670 [Streptomyces erythrochromogenes]
MPWELRDYAGRHYAVLFHHEIMRWFMEQVTDQVGRGRTAFAQGEPEAGE